MFQCRFYEQEWPEEGEIVVVKVKDETFAGGLYCTLMEYNGIEGYVQIGDFSRLKRRSARPSAMKKGQLDLAKVGKVDVEKGYIDLNKEQLPREVVEEVTIRWNNSRKINSIMKSVAHRVETPVEELYRKFLWPLARDMKKLGKPTITGLSCFLNDPVGMTKKYNLRQNFVDALIPLIKENLKPKQHRITALIQVNSFSWQGVTLIKKALKAGALVSTRSCPVQIILREPPSTWEIKMHTLKPEEGSIVIWKILEKIRRVLTLGNRGQFRLIQAPVMRGPYKNKTSVACEDPKIQIVENPLFDYAADCGSSGNKSFIEGRSSAEQDKLSGGTASRSIPESTSTTAKQKNCIELDSLIKGKAGGRVIPNPVPHKEKEYSSFSRTRGLENPACSTNRNSQLPASQQVQSCQVCGKLTAMVCGNCEATSYCSSECQLADLEKHEDYCFEKHSESKNEEILIKNEDNAKSESVKLEMAELEGVPHGSPGFSALLEKPFSVSLSLLNGKETKNKPLASIPSALLPPPNIRQSSTVISRPKVSGYHLIRPVDKGRNITDPGPYTKRSAFHKYPHLSILPSSIDQELSNFVRAIKPPIADTKRDRSKTTESTLRKIPTSQQEDNKSGSAAGTGDSLPQIESLRASNSRA